MNVWWLCYLPIIMCLFWFHKEGKQRQKFLEARIRKRNGEKEMQELAKRFIGKEVLADVISDEGSFEGILKEVIDNAMVLEKDGEVSVINLDFVVRLREYPRNKKGKKKAIVLN